MDDYNSRIRRSQAVAEREFLEARLRDARAELRIAEDSLLAFLRENRRVENSPQLTFERDRLQSRVSLRQQVYETLFQAFEQSRIEEVRDTPVITVVERPIRPAQADPLHLPVLAAVGLLLGAIVASLVTAGLEYAALARERRPDEWSELMRLRERIAEEVRSPLAGLLGHRRARDG